MHAYLKFYSNCQTAKLSKGYWFYILTDSSLWASCSLPSEDLCACSSLLLECLSLSHLSDLSSSSSWRAFPHCHQVPSLCFTQYLEYLSILTTACSRFWFLTFHHHQRNLPKRPLESGPPLLCASSMRKAQFHQYCVCSSSWFSLQSMCWLLSWGSSPHSPVNLVVPTQMVGNARKI